MRITPALALVALVTIAGCKGEAPTPAGSTDAVAPPVTEKVFDLVGTIVGRDATASTLTIDHSAIGDWMDAMTMTFPVRGAEIASLPEDGAKITAKVHVQSTGDFWVSDIVEAPVDDAVQPPPTDTTDTSDPPQEISL